ncbi:putative metalloprotease CJM1_0395 family protein [Desulfobulbus propionicus]|jgi:hypothetical protein
MLAFSTSSSSATDIAYNRGGQAVVPFRSEPVQRITAKAVPESGDDQATGDIVSLSGEGLARSRGLNGQPLEPGKESDPAESQRQGGEERSATPQDLAPEEEKMVRELKQRDREVKAHEMAHLAVAGQYARGGASYTYQQGPDGRRYAVGGEVPVDLSEEKTPEETIEKMRVIRRAAMAPAEPSSADRSVAANASAIEGRARQELQAQEAQEAEAARSRASSGERETGSAEGADAAAPPSESPQVTPSLDVVA